MTLKENALLWPRSTGGRGSGFGDGIMNIFVGEEEEEPAFMFSGVAGAEEPRPFTIGSDVAAEPFSGVAGADLGFTSGGDTAVSDKTGISSSVSESTARQRRGVRCASVARGVGSFGRVMDAARGELVTARGRESGPHGLRRWTHNIYTLHTNSIISVFRIGHRWPVS